jgi:lysophospholipase L1-like esterase
MNTMRRKVAGVVVMAAAVAGMTAFGARAGAEEKTSWAFDFSGGGKGMAVQPNVAYSAEAGFGFEQSPAVKMVRGAAGGAEVSDKPFFFSAAVPEGNYKVTAVVGDPEAASDVTIKAELRRLMVQNVRTEPGQFQTVDFIVNVRRPEFEGGKVKLKQPREAVQEAWAWDDKLTLEFNGKRPAVQSLRIEKVDVPTVYVLGDSTVCDQSGEPYASWGQMLTNFFKDDIAIANHGESGETIASSDNAGRFKKILSLIKPGDFFIEQFGHNDMKAKGEGAAEKYEKDLESWVSQIKAKGATAIVVTPMNRHTFREGKVTDSLAPYPDKVREAAKNTGAILIDLNKMSASLYEALGEKGSNQLFEHETPEGKHDGTHHSPMGAYELARCVVQGIREGAPELAKHVKDDVKTFDPSKPDWTDEAAFPVPPSPGKTEMVPLGAGGANQ